MQAQESLGSAGGAIVYEFEKDDDYDEEDPYEDPFKKILSFFTSHELLILLCVVNYIFIS